MIRRLFALCVFVITVTLASFGQQVFGREHLIVLAHDLKTEGPQKARTALHQTDVLLASLAPQAGVGNAFCTLDSLEWAQHLYQ